MVRLLQLLIFGHVHKWRETNRVRLSMQDSGDTGTRVYCTCETCGEPRKFDLI